MNLTTPKWRKTSKRWRKELNQIRNMSDVPMPARRFTIAPTDGRILTDRRCGSISGWTFHRRPGWRGLVDRLRFRKPIPRPTRCGAQLELVPYNGRRRGHLKCPSCHGLHKNLRRRSSPKVRRGRAHA